MEYCATIFLLAVFTVLWLNTSETCCSSTESSKEVETVSEVFKLASLIPTIVAWARNRTSDKDLDVSDLTKYMNCSCFEAMTQCWRAFNSSDFLATPLTIESKTIDSTPNKYNCSKASSNTWIICDERVDYQVSNTEQCEDNVIANISCKPFFGTFIISSSSYLELITKNETIVFLTCKGALQIDERGLHQARGGEGRMNTFTLIIILSVTCAVAVLLIIGLSAALGIKRRRSSKLSKEQKTSSDPTIIYSNADNAVEKSWGTNRSAKVAKSPNKYPDTAAAYSSPYQVAIDEQATSGQPVIDSQGDEDTSKYSLASGTDACSGLQMSARSPEPLAKEISGTGDLGDSQNGGTNYPGCSVSAENVDESTDIFETNDSNEVSIAFPPPDEYARLGQQVRRKTRDNYDIWPLPFGENPAIQLMQLTLNN